MLFQITQYNHFEQIFTYPGHCFFTTDGKIFFAITIINSNRIMKGGVFVSTL